MTLALSRFHCHSAPGPWPVTSFACCLRAVFTAPCSWPLTSLALLHPPPQVKYGLPGRVDVGGEISARDIIIATGSVPFVPPGTDSVNVILRLCDTENIRDLSQLLLRGGVFRVNDHSGQQVSGRC